MPFFCFQEDLTSNSLTLNRNPLEPEPLPLSSIEEDLRNAKISESNPNDLRSITVNQTLRGVAFPVDQEALEKLQSLKNGEINYVQLVLYFFTFLNVTPTFFFVRF